MSQELKELARWSYSKIRRNYVGLKDNSFCLKTKLSQDKIMDIVTDALSGKYSSYNEIARKNGVSHTTVRNYLVKQGVVLIKPEDTHV